MKNSILLIGICTILGGCCTLLNIPKYCPPDADFNSDKSTIVENESIQFMDQSSGDPDTWIWTFQGGEPATSSAQNPRVMYPTEGTYPVSLTVRNRYGSNTESKTSYILVKGETKCKEISFKPGPYLRLCPNHINGDREFNGNGPDVEANAELRIDDARKIYVDLFLHEKETKHDWTECQGDWTKLIYTAPNGWEIKSIKTDMISTTSYRDTDHSLDVPVVSGGDLVKRFEIIGDTHGLDVGNCTSGDAYMNVYFNDVRVEICESTR